MAILPEGFRYDAVIPTMSAEELDSRVQEAADIVQAKGNFFLRGRRRDVASAALSLAGIEGHSDGQFGSIINAVLASADEKLAI